MNCPTLERCFRYEQMFESEGLQIANWFLIAGQQFKHHKIKKKIFLRFACLYSKKLIIWDQSLIMTLVFSIYVQFRYSDSLSGNNVLSGLTENKSGTILRSQRDFRRELN